MPPLPKGGGPRQRGGGVLLITIHSTLYTIIQPPHEKSLKKDYNNNARKHNGNNAKFRPARRARALYPKELNNHAR